jgi:4-amino-4-deoxy-L-arabinose transferase-like glycosyltransferase
MARLAPGRSRRFPAILLALGLLAAHVAWQTWLVGADRYPAAYDYDEGVYAETAWAAESGARLYARVFLSQPPLLIGVLSRAYRTFGPTLPTARGVVIGFSVVWLLSLAGIAAAAGPRRAGLWTVAAALSAPAFVMASHTVEMEAPAEALAALAVALSLAGCARAGRNGGAGSMWWTAAGVAAGLAVMTKVTALTCLVPVTAAAWRHPRNGAIAAAGIVAGAAAVVAWTGAAPDAMWSDAAVFHAAVARAMPFDPARALALLEGFARGNWSVTVLGVAGLALTVRTLYRPGTARVSRPGRLAAVWLAADLAAVLAARPLWPHHLVILISPLAVLAAVAIEAGVLRPVRAGGVRAAAAIVLVAAWMAAVAAAAAALAPAASAPLARAAAYVRAEIPPDGQLLADDPMIAFLGGRTVPPALCDTSEVRSQSGWLTATMLRAAAGDPRVAGVVLWRGTFRRLFPAFVAAAARDFPHRWAAGGAVILSR